MVITLILVRVRTKRSSTTSTYNSDNCDSYRAYEPSPPQPGHLTNTLKKKKQQQPNNNNNNSGGTSLTNRGASTAHEQQQHQGGSSSGPAKAWQSETLPRSRSQSSASFINNNLGISGSATDNLSPNDYLDASGHRYITCISLILLHFYFRSWIIKVFWNPDNI